MYNLFIANKNYSSWSLRPWLLLKQLDIPFHEILMPFGTDAWLKNPAATGQVPCLQDGETVIWDTLSITEYLAETHPSIWPLDKATRAWARSVTAEMHSGFNSLRELCTNNIGLRIELDVKTRANPHLIKDIKRIDQLWNEGLTRFGGPFLTGNAFTAVDAFFAPVAFRCQTYSLELSPTGAEYARRLRDLPHMQQWYQDALAEIWRDEAHEVEARASGKWLQDLRAG